MLRWVTIATSYPIKPTLSPDILKFFTPRNLLGLIPLLEIPGQQPMIAGMAHLKYHPFLYFCLKPPPLWESLILLFCGSPGHSWLTIHNRWVHHLPAFLLGCPPSAYSVCSCCSPYPHQQHGSVVSLHTTGAWEQLDDCTLVLGSSNTPAPLLIHSGNRSRIVLRTLKFQQEA